MELGCQLEHCRLNCKKSARNWDNLYENLKIKLTALEILPILEDKFQPILHHHIPKISISGCPNGCSQPNIKDFGISGYVNPRITDAPCSGCNACVRSCLENAITWQSNGIIIDYNSCISCGDCQRACPSGTIISGEVGWELRFGGRVGRHPKFAVLDGKVQTDEEVVAWISEKIRHYLEEGRPQERLTHFLERQNF